MVEPCWRQPAVLTPRNRTSTELDMEVLTVSIDEIPNTQVMIPTKAIQSISFSQSKMDTSLREQTSSPNPKHYLVSIVFTSSRNYY